MATLHEKASAGFWTWEPPGKAIRIHIDLDTVDRMMHHIVDGFGSVPKRGAEVGGILIGSAQRPNGKLEVTITDFLPVPCTHRFGPSYVLSNEDVEGLAAAVASAGGACVGYYRSNTRERMSLGPEDLEYCQSYFPGPDQVVLLIRPSAMQASRAGFHFYEEGALVDPTPLEFPFRRSELESGAAPQRRPLGERRPAAPSPPPPSSPAPSPQSLPATGRAHGREGLASIQEAAMARDPQPSAAVTQPMFTPQPQQPQFSPLPPAPHLNYPVPSMAGGIPRTKRNWVWFPLSFIFLLLGVLLGFQAALTFNGGKATSQDPYSLSLGVERRQSDLIVRWDRTNGAVRTSSKGVLDIQDGPYSKRVDLDSSQLQTGSVIYRFSSPKGKFKLELYPKDRVVMSETIDWSN
ncbi:MAG: hypothetical protein JST65_06665 [Acidobacteria bacterium]|nr:hypothetical protein [Acidobacteriota bacterium]